MRINFLFLVGIFFLASNAFAENSAMDCVSAKWQDNDYVFRNICDYNIYIMYCSTDKKISGKYCGDYKGSNENKGSYYTHSFNLKRGKSRSKWKPGDIKYAACKGMTGFGRTFTDYSDGRFSCEEPRRLYD